LSVISCLSLQLRNSGRKTALDEFERARSRFSRAHW
jgi:hypothetical protein